MTSEEFSEAQVEAAREAYAVFGQQGHLRALPPSKECVRAMLQAAARAADDEAAYKRGHAEGVREERDRTAKIEPEPDITRWEVRGSYEDGYVTGFWEAVVRYRAAILGQP